MLYAKPVGWFATKYHVLSRGQQIARLDFEWPRELARFALNGHQYEAGRRGPGGLVGAFQLQCDNQTVYTVRRPNFFSRRYELLPAESEAPDFVLVAVSAFSRRFRVKHSTTVVGEIRPVSIFSGAAEIDLPEDVPVALQVFLLWLVVTSWRQSNGDGS